MATAITDVFGRHASTQDVIAGTGPAPRPPQAVAVGTASWLSALPKDGQSSYFAPPSPQPCGSNSLREGTS
jgi:hypothetical protein